jgi:putative lipoic acid-binding regulatory protein
MNGKILVMTRQNANQATADLTMRATSDGQYVDFTVHVIINVIVDEPPYIVNPVQDVAFIEYPQTVQVGLDGVATDPDDPDENITYSIVSNSNPSALTASMSGKTLVMTRQTANQATVDLTMRATSDGQYVDFTVHVILKAVVDNPPYIVNPVPNVVFNEFPQTIEVDLTGVATDPDDPDENIVYRIIDNPSPENVTATMNGRILVLERQANNDADFTIQMRATSDGQHIDFEVHLIMYIIDGVEDNQTAMAIYPNPTNSMITIDLPENQSFEYEVYDLVGHNLLKGRSNGATRIDLTSCRQGVYFIVVIYDNNRLTQKVIVQ